MTDHIKRDRWDRPLIIPPGGGEPVAYARPSKLAKSLDDQYQLMQWQNRKTLEGVLRRPDLMTRTAGVIAKGDPDTDWPTKQALNAIAAEAREASGSSKGSSAGTGFHHLTDAYDSGEPPAFVPPGDAERLERYIETTQHIDWLDIETFIVNDDVTAAGTFDRLGRLPDGRVVVADLKSGKSEADYPLSTAIQIAIYARGKRYNHETGERSPLHPELDLSTGLLIHLPPRRVVKGVEVGGGCELYELDLDKGWKAAGIAALVHHDIRKWKAEDLCQPVFF